MRCYSMVLPLLTLVCVGVCGCSDASRDVATAAPTPTTPNPPSNREPVVLPNDEVHPPLPSASPSDATTQSASAATTTPAKTQSVTSESARAPQAEVTAADIAPPAEPTTAAAALAVIDLEALPKPKVNQQLDSQPMSIYYSTEGTIASVDEFTKSELAKAGWSETKHLVTSTNQYVDRLMTKNGYYMRVTISTGSSPTEIAVNMSVLGNFDVRTLPKTKDAEDQESTQVMAGHRTNLSIPDAFDELSKQMVQAGWQIVQEFQAPMPDVPHYRSIRFRKHAIRVNLGLAKDPSKPSEKTNIFYHAESVMPIDLPTIDHREPIKFDVTENRASMPWKGDRQAMVNLLTKHAPEFGWKLVNADDFIEEKSTVVYLSVGTPIGIAARRVETGGNYYLWMERVRLPTKPASEPTNDQPNQVAQTPVDPSAAKMKADIEKQIDEADATITKAVNDELAKALGSLSGPGKKPDMQALQAQAAKLQAQLEAVDKETDDATPTKTPATKPAKKANVLDVPDDDKPVSQEDLAIRVTEARVKLGNRQLVLKHCLCYARMEDDMPTKIILFSDKPLMADKLDKLCASGESFMIYDGFGTNRPDASLELRITGDQVMMNFAASGLSLATNVSDIQSTVRLKDGKLQGRVKLEKPVELQKESLTFEATIADKVRR